MQKLLSSSLVLAAAALSSASGCDNAAAAQQTPAVQTSAAALHVPPPPNVPAALQAPANEEPKLMAYGDGVQIYQCGATTSGTYAFSLLAPEADLTDNEGDYIANHFLGPTWQARDGSKIKGTVVAKVTVDPTAIPWLLLSTVSSDRPGWFTDVTHVQRLYTAGGLAPATGCDSTQLGVEVRVPYTAQYYFYHVKGSDCDGGDHHHHS